MFNSRAKSINQNKFKAMFTTNVSSHTVTSRFFKFLFLVILIIIPMIIVWALLAQFNVFGLNWAVPLGGKYFLDQEKLEQIKQNLQGWNEIAILRNAPNFFNWEPLKVGNQPGDLNEQSIEAILKTIPNYGHYVILNGLLFVPIFGILVFDVILALFLIFFTKWFFIDVFPNLLSTWLVMFLFVIGLLMPWNNLAMTIPVTIIIIVVGWVISFVILNTIFNKIIISSKYADLYYFDLIKQDKESKKYVDDYTKAKMKLKQDKDLDVIEIEEEEK